MGKEIERKFLVQSDAWKAQIEQTHYIKQGYLHSDTRVSVRIRIQDESANINIKSGTLGIERLEYEYPVPLEEANEMLDQLADGPLIEKRRHKITKGNHVWEVDEFLGDNLGLIVAEVELASVGESPDIPEWAGDDVSNDERYYNVCLARHPYTQW